MRVEFSEWFDRRFFDVFNPHLDPLFLSLTLFFTYNVVNFTVTYFIVRNRVGTPGYSLRALDVVWFVNNVIRQIIKRIRQIIRSAEQPSRR